MNEEVMKAEATAVIVEKPYTLRAVEADDIDYIASIIDKIGIEKIAESIDKKEVSKLIDGREISDDVIKEVGISAMVKIASIIVKNYRVAKTDIYSLLASMSGQTVDEIKHLKLPVYIQMIMDVFKQDGFIDSFKLASSFLK